MSERGENDPAEARAAQRYGALQAVRFGSLALVIVGIAAANEALPLPYALGVVLAVGGLIGFFFAPPLLVRRWKAGDGE
ncbi:MAG: hypothetical protein V2I27_15660 [Erythrobacter sp.]|jgi:hypothetical protein|nr:hypothetical protein [Erythrobacter sp.]